MGTHRRVAIWYIRRRGEYVMMMPGHKNAEMVFTNQQDMQEAAKASKLILRQVGMARREG